MDEIRQCKVIQVIATEVIRGDGKETIMRGVMQYWGLDGALLAENDPCAGKEKVGDSSHFDLSGMTEKQPGESVLEFEQRKRDYIRFTRR